MITTRIVTGIAIALLSSAVAAKLPPPPPVDPAVAAAKAEKDKAAAEKTKADQARYEDIAVKNFQANMKKAGKPIPKPTPIVVAAAPAAPAKGAPAAPAKAPPAKK
ncbi:MAG TPA: hypothetical protein VFV17_09240 [Usitatibacteraceae bacterium]|nr:hypothetical protein [Usitatibacteraceae bacterium]